MIQYKKNMIHNSYLFIDYDNIEMVYNAIQTGRLCRFTG